MYFDQLATDQREAYFAIMRRLGEESESYWRNARALEPPPGRLGVGSSDLDYRLRAIVVDEFLSQLRDGMPPSYAAEAAKREGEAFTIKWNEKGRFARVAITSHGEYVRDAGWIESFVMGLRMRFKAFEPAGYARNDSSGANL
jgi:hypothetical protein